MRILFAIFFACTITNAALAKDACYIWPYEDTPPPLAEAVVHLDNIPATAKVVETYKPVLCQTRDSIEALGTFDPETGIIVLSDGLSPAEATAILIHEIRHLDQSLPESCLAPNLTMQDWTRAIFALEADAMAITMLSAWLLAEAGSPDIWEAVSDMPETQDIAEGFKTVISETGDPAQATAAAFTAWYGSDARREEYYVSVCEGYLSTQEREKRLPGYLPLADDFLSSICKLPSGGFYPCSEPDNPLPR